MLHLAHSDTLLVWESTVTQERWRMAHGQSLAFPALFKEKDKSLLPPGRTGASQPDEELKKLC